MSGGVDSAVAAARAAEAGHDVTGVHLALSENPKSFRTGARGCCTIEDSHDARRAADVIGIPFYVWDLAERFREDVVDDFIAEYEAGRTPNPCLRCNEKIKFAALLDKALALGFDAVCTGHYATVVPARGRHPRAAPRLRHGQGPVVRPRRARRPPARPRDVPARRHPHHQAGDPRRGRPPRPGRRARSPTATTSASSPTATPRASSPSGSARPRATSSTRPAEGRHPRRRVRLHHRPAQGPAHRPPGRRRQAALRPRHLARRQHRHGRPRRRARRHGAHRHPAPLVRHAPRPAPPRTPRSCAPTAARPRRRRSWWTERCTSRSTEPVRGVAPGQAIVLYDGTRVVGSATIATTKRHAAALTP